MKRHQVAATVIAVQAIVFPIFWGAESGSDRIWVICSQVLVAIICIAVFAQKRWALRTALALMAVQIPVVESTHATWHVCAGSSVALGILKGESWLDSRLGLKCFSGYDFNGAVFRPPVKMLLTDGRDVTGAFFLNIAVLPATLLLLPRKQSKTPHTPN